MNVDIAFAFVLKEIRIILHTNHVICCHNHD